MMPSNLITKKMYMTIQDSLDIILLLEPATVGFPK